MRSLGPVLAVVIAIIAAAALVGGTYASYVAPPTVVRFDGVALSIHYGNGSSGLFGPAQQNSCNETLPWGPQWSALGPSCPPQLVGGASYVLQFIVLGNPCLPSGNPCSALGLWTNLTLRASFFFQLNPIQWGASDTSLNSSTGLFQANQTFLFGPGDWEGWVAVFTLPSHFAPPPWGLWLNATLSIQLTNQTQV